MYSQLRSLLFRLDPETAHHFTLGLLKWGGNIPPTRALLRAMFIVDDPRLHVDAFGLSFKNPIGLAAGYDKNGVAVQGLGALGFGHIEVGTVTPRPQSGNERPRVWRAPETHALVNRMGFPNEGVEQLHLPSASALAQQNLRLGVNFGKNKDTPLECAADDYVALLKHVQAQTGTLSPEGNGWDADYCAVNVSSPNTPGLRALQAREYIEPLLRTVAGVRDGLARRVPLLVKIAPDLSAEEIEGIVDAARDSGFDGIIATNTTSSRDGAPEYTQQWQGGLSGAPLHRRSTEIIHHIAAYTQGDFPIIGVGGITDAESALEKLRAGASLIQVFTGLVYQGPGLVKQINQALVRAKNT